VNKAARNSPLTTDHSQLTTMLKYIKQYADSIKGVDIYPIISLLIFVLFFIAVIYYVRKMDKQRVAEMKNLPLDLEPENNATLHTI
jgi:cbb3-type cytochrome oxidase subunit 3